MMFLILTISIFFFYNPFGTREKHYKLPYASFLSLEKRNSEFGARISHMNILELGVVHGSGWLHHQ